MAHLRYLRFAKNCQPPSEEAEEEAERGKFDSSQLPSPLSPPVTLSQPIKGWGHSLLVGLIGLLCLWPFVSQSQTGVTGGGRGETKFRILSLLIAVAHLVCPLLNLTPSTPLYPPEISHVMSLPWESDPGSTDHVHQVGIPPPSLSHPPVHPTPHPCTHLRSPT